MFNYVILIDKVFYCYIEDFDDCHELIDDLFIHYDIEQSRCEVIEIEPNTGKTTTYQIKE